MSSYTWRMAVAIGFGLSLVSTVVSAQVTKIVTEGEAGEESTTYRMTVSPAPQTRPALRVRLLTPTDERVPDNAATFYYKSMAFEGPDRLAVFSYMADEEGEAAEAWRDMPLDRLPVKEVETKIPWITSRATQQALAQATRCDHCDWGDPIREDGMATLLPQASKMNSVARAWALKAHCELAQGKFDDALATLRQGYVAARHLAHAPTLVQGLIGMRTQDYMHQQARWLMTMEGSPNLYGAFTELAAEPLDFRHSLDFEYKTLEFTCPLLKEIDRRPFTLQEANNIFIFNDTEDLMTLAFQKDEEEGEGKDPWGTSKLTNLLWVLLYEPSARQYLFEHGYTAARLDAMPVLQVVFLARWEQYKLQCDEMHQCLLLPPQEARSAVKRVSERLEQAMRRGEGLPFALVLPPQESCFIRQLDCQREIEVLRLIEALRMHAAEHGRWPERLADITAVSVPRDPVTEQPFVYTLEEGVATISLPPTEEKHYQFRYELTLRPTKAVPAEEPK